MPIPPRPLGRTGWALYRPLCSIFLWLSGCSQAGVLWCGWVAVQRPAGLPPSASLPFSEMAVVCPLLVLSWLCLHHECGLRSPLPWIHMHPEFCPLHLPEEILPGLSGPSALAICCLCFLVSLFLSLWGSCHLWCVGPRSWPHVFQWLAENGHLRTSEDGFPSARTLRESLAEFQVADRFPRIWKAVPPAFPSSSSVPWIPRLASDGWAVLGGLWRLCLFSLRLAVLRMRSPSICSLLHSLLSHPAFSLCVCSLCCPTHLPPVFSFLFCTVSPLALGEGLNLIFERGLRFCFHVFNLKNSSCSLNTSFL